MYTVKQAADQLNITTETIRYYTRLGMIEPRRDPNNSYRYYSDTDIQLIDFIRKAKYYGLTIHEIGMIIKKSSEGQLPCELVMELITNRYSETRAKIEELKILEERLATALLTWESDDNQDLENVLICPLIEKNNA